VSDTTPGASVDSSVGLLSFIRCYDPFKSEYQMLSFSIIVSVDTIIPAVANADFGGDSHTATYIQSFITQ